MSKLLDEIRGIEPGSPSTAATQAIANTSINVERDLDALAEAVESVLPNAVANMAAVKGSWTYEDGTRAIVYAVVSPREPKANVTVYRSGKVVWAGMEPCYQAP